MFAGGGPEAATAGTGSGGCEDRDVVMSVFLTGLPYFVPGLPPRLFVPPLILFFQCTARNTI